MANRYKRGGRKKKTPNDVILIVCGGQTECSYFKKFNINLGKVKVKTVLENTNPTKIVDKAKSEMKRGQYSQVWCVFDKDEFPDFDNAIFKARDNGIKVAYSNQAFELWFILHFRRQDGALHRKDYKRILEQELSKKYSKANDKMYDDLKDKLDQAIRNAKIGHQIHRRNGRRNPSDCESCTTVYKLAKELLKWKK